MADKLRQKDFKEFEKAFNQVKRANREERVDAVGLLTPSLLRKHIDSKQDLVLAYGRKGATVEYTVAELQEFARHIDRQEGRKQKNIVGVPLLKLEKLSWRDDKVRAQTQIKNATLYRILNNILHFQVTASGNNPGKSHHQVKIRLDEWYNYMTSTISWVKVSREVAIGRLSFDCSCGRHQYWFRYLATIGNFALTPKEKDFPKIRNPRLGGCCCKHVLKVLQQLKSPSVQQLIAKEMERQSESSGYVDKGQSKFLNAKELAKARRARGSGKNSAAVEQAYQDFIRARKSFSRKTKEKSVEEQLKTYKVKNSARKQENKNLKKRLKDQKEQANADKLLFGLRTALDMGEDMGMEREKIIERFAIKNDMKPIEVDAIAKEANL